MSLQGQLFGVSAAALLRAGAAAAPTAPEPPDSGATEVDQLVVTARPVSTIASSATRLPIDVRDTPQSIQVVPKELLDDRGVTRIGEALETVSGVREEASYGGNNATFFNIRGFSTSTTLRDGFISPGYFAPRDVQAIERIEVVKGPSGVLYGASNSVGGYINTVSKTAIPERFSDLRLLGGSYALIRATADLSQPLSAAVDTRLNLAVESNDTFRDFGGYDSWNIAPALTWRLGPSTTLTAVAEDTEFESDRYDFGIPNLPEAANLDSSRYFGVPADYGESDAVAGTVTLEHRLSEAWSVRLAGHAGESSQIATYSFPDPFSYTGGSTIGVFFYPDFYDNSENQAARAEVSGRFATGPIVHTLLVGVEGARRENSYGGADSAFYTLDLYDETLVPEIAPGFGPIPEATSTTRSLAGYVQDLVELAPNLKVLAGLRYDRVRSQADGETVIDSKASPRIGVVWTPVERTAVYAGYSRSFTPVSGRNVAGDPFSPERAEQYEVGVKQDLIPDRLFGTLAVFELIRSDVLTRDLANPLFRIQTGEQRSRGVELDANGALAPGWTVSAAYTYLDTEVTRDNSLPVGDALQDAPEHAASLFSTYEWQEGPLQGYGVSGGAFYVGEREATLPNSFKLDDYVRVDASVFRRYGRYWFQIDLRNAFDEEYVFGGAAANFGFTVMPGRPRSVQASVSAAF